MANPFKKTIFGKTMWATVLLALIPSDSRDFFIMPGGSNKKRSAAMNGKFSFRFLLNAFKKDGVKCPKTVTVLIRNLAVTAGWMMLPELSATVAPGNVYLSVKPKPHSMA